MTPLVFTPIAAAVIVAAFIQGTTGVGFALIVAPVLAFLAPDLVPVCLLVLMIPLNVYVAWRERAALDRSGAGWITAGRFLGTFGGLWVLAVLTSKQLNILIGAATILAAIMTLIAPSSPGRRAYVAAGVSLPKWRPHSRVSLRLSISINRQPRFAHPRLLLSVGN